MRLPFNSWTETFSKLGFRSTRSSRRKAKKARQMERRNMIVETLEPRQMLASDLQWCSFSSDGTDWQLQYEVTNDTRSAQAFEVGIYRTEDGKTPESQIGSLKIDSAELVKPGKHTVTISPDFADGESFGDYSIMAVIDPAGYYPETDESNNDILFGGDAFLSTTRAGTLLTRPGTTLHIHGSRSHETFELTNTGFITADVDGILYEYQGTKIDAIAIHGHKGDDTIVIDEGITQRTLIYGGRGDDTLSGGSGADQLYGGRGKDILIGNKGADRLSGGDHDDRLHGGAGFDTLLGDKGDDRLLGGLDRDVLYGGLGSDYIEGGSGIDELHGGDITEGSFRYDTDVYDTTAFDKLAPEGVGELFYRTPFDKKDISIDLNRIASDPRNDALAYSIVSSENSSILEKCTIRNNRLAM